MAHAFNPSTQETRNLSYRIARVTERNPVSKDKTSKTTTATTKNESKFLRDQGDGPATYYQTEFDPWNLYGERRDLGPKGYTLISRCARGMLPIK